MMGLTLYRLSEFALAREHFEQDLTLSHAEEHALTGPIGPEVYCRSCAAWNLWILGHPDQALQSSHDALRLAQKLAHPFTLARALTGAAAFHLLRKEGDTAQEYVERYLALSTEHGLAFELVIGTIQRGEALARQGQVEEGIALLREGLTARQATGAEAERSYYLAVLAEAYGAVGRAEEGLTVLAEALSYVDNTGERYWEAELYRLKGQLTLQQFQVSGSEFQVVDP